MRVLEFGFSGLKRADLEKAVGALLEEELPHDLEELVYDFEPLPAPGAAPRPGAVDDPTVVKTTRKTTPVNPAGTRVLAAATTRDRVKQFLALAARHGFEPRSVLAAPTVYARVVDKLGASAGKDEAVLLIDHGHSRTNLCVVQSGHAVFARTLSRGGRHVTAAIARACNVSLDEAERAKHTDAFVACASDAAVGPDARHPTWPGISDLVRQELAPVVRDLRQTLSACRTQTGVVPVRAILAGGGGRLRGLAEYLSEELDLPVGRVTGEDSPALVGAGSAPGGVGADTSLLAHGVALEGATGRPLFDLRRGDLAYRADFSYLRARAGFLAACALVLVAFGAANAYAALYTLRREEKLLGARLSAASTEVFGKPLSVDEVEAKIAPHKESSPLPKWTAFDQLVEISKRLPARDAVKLDVSDLQIEPGKVVVKATTDSEKSIGTIKEKLAGIECFVETQRGRVTGETEKQFTLTITTKCM
jgi:general secretion pathway protein L